MVKPSHQRQLNTAGLEADVMRFMAIIAFCLIAIMALVKDAEQPTDTIPTSPENRTLVREPAKPAPDPKPVLNDRTSVVQTTISQSTVRKVPVPESSPSRPAIPGKPETAVVAPAKSRPFIPEDTAMPLAVDDSITPNAKPLTFRFESDKTFLHLIANNRLQLYASTANGFLAMDSGFSITDARPSGELFEVMAQSIPVKIKLIFRRKNVSPVYLVALPSETRRDLRKFLEAPSADSTTGVLVIHRNGHISHET